MSPACYLFVLLSFFVVPIELGVPFFHVCVEKGGLIEGKISSILWEVTKLVVVTSKDLIKRNVTDLVVIFHRHRRVVAFVRCQQNRFVPYSLVLRTVEQCLKTSKFPCTLDRHCLIHLDLEALFWQ